MIAVDTNILVYAHRSDHEWHQAARERVRELAESRHRWAIPWPCVHEFLATVTHPRRFSPPTPVAVALEQVEAWSASLRLSLLGETDRHLELLRALLEGGKLVGPRVHDARIAAICLQHGVDVLWTADRDFSRFPSLKVENPLVG